MANTAFRLTLPIGKLLRMAILTRMEIGMTVIGMGIVTAIAMATTTVDYTAGGISMTATMMVIATATRAVTAGAGGCQPTINRVSTATTRAGCNTAAIIIASRSAAWKNACGI